MKPGISLFFPVYNDESTIRIVAEKAIRVLSDVAEAFEIVIVNDGSPDASGRIADELAREDARIRVIHHEANRGYGAALQTGFKAANQYEWICSIDGDDQYDAEEIRHIVKLLSRYDLIITFRYCKIYSTWRLLVSSVYNRVLRYLFRSPFRDISTGMRFVRREVLDDVTLSSHSPFIGAELALKAMLKGYRVGEVGISTYPRYFGRSESTSFKNIIATIRDMLRVHGEVFANTPRNLGK